ncbi:helix-turn-helix transcriptional regulator [Phenylobacterium sp. LjRoot225]|uniref:helix-turn-helix domain-containing protein n=1 Tax=Phenylobacterium sp. LjRoot225 TaxID=3342285 RepID=UPI003ED0AF4C
MVYQVAGATVTNVPGGSPVAVGAIGEHYVPALWADVRRMDTPALTAIVVDFERDFPIAGSWLSDDVHFFDMALSARPAASRGFFADVSNEPRNYGKVFVVPAGYRLHGEGPVCRQRSLYLFLRPNRLFPDEQQLGEDLTPVLRECLNLKSDAVRETLGRIAREVHEPGFASELLVEGLGLTALAETARALRNARDHGAGRGGLPPWRRKLIEERVRCGDSPPTIAELAKLCGLSRRQLMRAFREETGRTVGAFVQDLTLERAKTLLRETERPIGVVAAEVGFANAAAFATAFRRATGQTPRSFRAARRAR